MNLEKAQGILQTLLDQGVKTLCVCAGARNAPFIKILSQPTPFEVLSFYDERSAGFFALGRARRDKAPVAVLTTSGTAVAELLSSVIEAHYSNTPLVVLSSDRPKKLRGTGAPQTIDQSALFQGYVEKAWDIEVDERASLEISLNKPSHINICFDEPLLAGEMVPFTVSHASPKNLPVLTPKKMTTALQAPLVVVGALPAEGRAAVVRALRGFDVPIFAEATSGLRSLEVLSDKIIRGGEKGVSEMLASGEVKSVLRLGDVPLGRYWRDLESMGLPVVSFSDKEYGGLSHGTHYQQHLTDIDENTLQLEPWPWRAWQRRGEQVQQKIESLLSQFPKSEAAFVQQLTQIIPKSDPVYLGNSLPIREWDLLDNSQRFITANRGANGIDGQISSALGGAHTGGTQWIVLGDLTTLYDFNGLWVTPYLKDQHMSIHLVVINNEGGQIFSRIFQEKLFQNNHSLDFSAFAKMWGWNYSRLSEGLLETPKPGLNLIELCPDQEQSRLFWEGYDRIWS